MIIFLPKLNKLLFLLLNFQISFFLTSWVECISQPYCNFAFNSFFLFNSIFDLKVEVFDYSCQSSKSSVLTLSQYRIIYNMIFVLIPHMNKNILQ